jgi:hypothetical protein
VLAAVGEAGEPKGFYSVEISPGQEPKVVFFETPARRFVTVEAELRTPEDLVNWYEILGGKCGSQHLLLPETAGAIVRVKYRAPEEVAKMVNHQEIIRRLNTAGAHYVAGIQAEVERLTRARDEEVTEATGVSDALAKYLERNGVADDGLTGLAQELLQEVQAA